MYVYTIRTPYTSIQTTSIQIYSFNASLSSQNVWKVLHMHCEKISEVGRCFGKCLLEVRGGHTKRCFSNEFHVAWNKQLVNMDDRMVLHQLFESCCFFFMLQIVKPPLSGCDVGQPELRVFGLKSTHPWHLRVESDAGPVHLGNTHDSC